MKRFQTDISGIINSGVEVLTNNLETMQNGPEDEIMNRFTDAFTPGILSQSSGTPFILTDTGLGNITVGSGVGYKTDSVSGKTERIAILTTDTTAYDATLPAQQTSDGIGGYVDTPKSSGCVGLPITDDSITYYIGIKYLRICDSNTPLSPTNYSLHPVTNKREFYLWKDGYEIEIQTNSTLIEGLLLGNVNRTGSVITVNMSGREYCALKPQVNLLANTNIADGVITTPKLANSAVTGEKVDTSVAGNGLSKDFDNSLKVNVDNATIEINTDTLRVKAGGITNTQLGLSAVQDSNILSGTITPLKFSSSIYDITNGFLGCGSATGIRGCGFYGVYGNGDTGVGGCGSVYGILGDSTTGVGVSGSSVNNSGVSGCSANSKGVLGYSVNCFGVHGHSDNCFGVYGYSNSNNGVYGYSITNNGVSGYSSSSNGVHGYSVNGSGVSGCSADCTGVFGYGSIYDFLATGPGIHYGCSSSKRWKTNIYNISCALDKVKCINGVYFDWNEQCGGKHAMGLIAENVGEIVPEAVSFEDSSKPENIYIENGIEKTYASGVDAAALVPVLIEAIKELNNRIEILENK